MLCGRVKEPTIKDYQRLHRIVKYIAGTVGYGLRFCKLSDVNNLCVYCDAAFGIDVGYKSRTGVVIIYAGAAILCKSSKQSIVTKSSAEAELVALCDGVAMVMACRNFLSGLGVELGPSTVYEDNKAVLEMIKVDGPYSLRTRHLSIRLFFSKQFVDNGDIVVRYCATENMIADMLTKPLVGARFRMLRDKLLSCEYRR